MINFDALLQVHFIRPIALYLTFSIPIIIAFKYLFINFQKYKNKPHGWNDLCSKEVLEHLYINNTEKISNSKYLSMIFTWLLIIIALAGPSLSKQEVEIHQNTNSWIIALSLAESMENTDIKPSRLERAKYKIKDFLSLINDQRLAFLVYTDTAFEIIPLTSDKKTIEHIIPSIEPLIMPTKGDDINSALITAKKLSNNLNLKNSNILILTDSKANSESLITAKELSKDHISVSIIDFNKYHVDTDNNSLQELANLSNGTYKIVSNNDADIKSVITSATQVYKSLYDSSKNQLKVTVWYDLGPWLLLFGLPLMFYSLFMNKSISIKNILYLFTLKNKKLKSAKPGFTILSNMFYLVYFNILFLLFIYLCTSNNAYAQNSSKNTNSNNLLNNSLDYLWLNKQQQAANKIKKNHDVSTLESNIFNSKQWQAATEYRKNQYSKSEQILKNIIDHDADIQNKDEVRYNYANSLAMQGKIKEAIENYKQVLDKNPNYQDAKYNKELLEKYLQSQQNKSNNQNNNKDQQDKSNKSNNNPENNQNNDQSQRQDPNRQSEPQKDQQDNQQQADNNTNQDKKQEEQLNSQKQANNEQQQIDDQKNNNNNVDNKQIASKQDKKQKDLDKWLDSIPDNPASYLRNQLYYEYWLDKQKKLQ